MIAPAQSTKRSHGFTVLPHPFPQGILTVNFHRRYLNSTTDVLLSPFSDDWAKPRSANGPQEENPAARAGARVDYLPRIAPKFRRLSLVRPARQRCPQNDNKDSRVQTLQPLSFLWCEREYLNPYALAHRGRHRGLDRSPGKPGDHLRPALSRHRSPGAHRRSPLPSRGGADQ